MSQTGTYDGSFSRARGFSEALGPGFDLRLLRKGLVAASATVILLGIFREWFVAQYGVETVFQDMRHIALDAEMCLGAWYSATLMVLAAGLMAVIARLTARSGRGMVGYWVVLAIVFIGLSLDEETSVHELAIEPLRNQFHLTGVFYFAWVVPGLILVSLFALVYARFLRALPRPYGLMFFVCGGVYVAGALGMEMVAGVIGEQGTRYIVCFITEESLEVAGMTMFVLTLLSYLRRHFDGLAVRF